MQKFQVIGCTVFEIESIVTFHEKLPCIGVFEFPFREMQFNYNRMRISIIIKNSIGMLRFMIVKVAKTGIRLKFKQNIIQPFRRNLHRLY